MSEELLLPRPLAEEMVAHLIEQRPNEGCGLLVGDGDRVTKVVKMSNSLSSPVRYALDPQEQFAAYKMIEDEGLVLRGVYHSHTHTEATPSPTDVKLASETVPYVIVSLAREPVVIRAFRIIKENWTDEHGEIVEVPVTIDG